MPTGDLAHFKDKFKEDTAQNQTGFGQRIKNTILKKMGKISIVEKPFEAKTILKRSMYFKNSRFRDILMEMAVGLNENAINNFLDNIDDIEVLFTAMSPSVVKLFEDSFKLTRFTQGIKNADWRQGDILEVIGTQSSIIMEKDANTAILKSQSKTFGNAGNVQNRQVEAKMLQIDWIFADCSSKT